MRKITASSSSSSSLHTDRMFSVTFKSHDSCYVIVYLEVYLQETLFCYISGFPLFILFILTCKLKIRLDGNTLNVDWIRPLTLMFLRLFLFVCLFGSVQGTNMNKICSCIGVVSAIAMKEVEPFSSILKHYLPADQQA